MEATFTLLLSECWCFPPLALTVCLQKRSTPSSSLSSSMSSLPSEGAIGAALKDSGLECNPFPTGTEGNLFSNLNSLTFPLDSLILEINRRMCNWSKGTTGKQEQWYRSSFCLISSQLYVIHWIKSPFLRWAVSLRYSLFFHWLEWDKENKWDDSISPQINYLRIWINSNNSNALQAYTVSSGLTRTAPRK